MTLPFLTPLRAGTLRDLGIGAPWTFGIADRVRFAELDALGHVGHTAYLRWFESFRVAHLGDRGVTGYDAGSPRLVLRRVECDYGAEMWLGETYVVTGRVATLKASSFVMDYAVHVLRGGGPVEAVQATAVIVLLDPGGAGRAPMAEEVRARLIELDGAAPA